MIETIQDLIGTPQNKIDESRRSLENVEKIVAMLQGAKDKAQAALDHDERMRSKHDATFTKADLDFAVTVELKYRVPFFFYVDEGHYTYRPSVNSEGVYEGVFTRHEPDSCDQCGPRRCKNVRKPEYEDCHWGSCGVDEHHYDMRPELTFIHLQKSLDRKIQEYQREINRYKKDLTVKQLIHSTTATYKRSGGYSRVVFLTKEERQAAKEGHVVWFTTGSRYGSVSSGYKVVKYYGGYDAREPSEAQLKAIKMFEEGEK